MAKKILVKRSIGQHLRMRAGKNSQVASHQRAYWVSIPDVPGVKPTEMKPVQGDELGVETVIEQSVANKLRVLRKNAFDQYVRAVISGDRETAVGCRENALFFAATEEGKERLERIIRNVGRSDVVEVLEVLSYESQRVDVLDMSANDARAATEVALMTTNIDERATITGSDLEAGVVVNGPVSVVSSKLHLTDVTLEGVDEGGSLTVAKSKIGKSSILVSEGGHFQEVTIDGSTVVCGQVDATQMSMFGSVVEVANFMVNPGVHPEGEASEVVLEDVRLTGALVVLSGHRRDQPSELRSVESGSVLQVQGAKLENVTATGPLRCEGDNSVDWGRATMKNVKVEGYFFSPHILEPRDVETFHGADGSIYAKYRSEKGWKYSMLTFDVEEGSWRGEKLAKEDYWDAQATRDRSSTNRSTGGRWGRAKQ